MTVDLISKECETYPLIGDSRKNVREVHEHHATVVKESSINIESMVKGFGRSSLMT